jgi:membrane-associated phospholipid phosphatase
MLWRHLGCIAARAAGEREITQTAVTAAPRGRFQPIPDIRVGKHWPTATQSVVLSAVHRVLLLPTCAFLALSTPAHAGSNGWATASDVGRDGLVIVALGLPAVQSDWQGTKQAAFSIGASSLASTGLKEIISEERPDGSNDQSFPSGHTSVSFAAAATLHKRYGWQVGLPAHLVAAFVGVARVKADKHFVHDVVAGAVIGEASGWILTRRKDDKVQWLPWADSHGGGVAMSLRF